MGDHQSCHAPVIAFAPPSSPLLFSVVAADQLPSEQLPNPLVPVDNPFEQNYAQVWRTMRLQGGNLRKCAIVSYFMYLPAVPVLYLIPVSNKWRFAVPTRIWRTGFGG